MKNFIINTLVAFLGITSYDSITGNENIAESVVIGVITITIFRILKHV